MEDNLTKPLSLIEEKISLHNSNNYISNRYSLRSKYILLDIRKYERNLKKSKIKNEKLHALIYGKKVFSIKSK